MTELASAPGKLIALGEYAILEGSVALVLAVNRRAVAYEADVDVDAPSRFLAAAEALCTAELGHAPAPVRVDTSAFRIGDRKLGLGSSAAATVAYVAGRLAQSGRPSDPSLVHRIAHQAHGDVSAREGARGSGADIAAAVWGGVIRVTPAVESTPAVTPLPTGGLIWVAIDSGKPADTRELVAAVHAFATRDPRRYRDHIEALGAAAETGCAALEAHSPRGLLSAFEDGLQALDALGRACALELVTEVHRQIAQTARNHGGAAKSTGAGGGDTALAAFDNEEAARRFCADLVTAGISPLQLDVSREGMLLFPSKSPR